MPDFSHCGNPSRRHDFVLLFDVKDGNPNGDPDLDNMPRQDQETNEGLVTDVCVKRKVRNYVSLTQPDAKPNRIYVQDRGIYLNDLHKEAYESLGVKMEAEGTSEDAKKKAKDKAKNPERGTRDKAREWMCANFYDVRMFGAVMSTGVNAGQVRGPVQMTFSRSIDPILPMDVTISRVALTDEKEDKNKQKADPKTPPPASIDAEEETVQEERFGRTGTFGHKFVVPYGLYRGHGFFSPAFAKQTGVTSDDLELFWKALLNTWDLDHSAARGLMSCRGLYVFSHNDPKGLGDAPAHKLFDRLSVERNPKIEIARRFEDYLVSLSGEVPEEKVYPDIVSGVTLTVLSAG